MPRHRHSVPRPPQGDIAERARIVGSAEVDFDLDLNPGDDPDAGFVYVHPATDEPLTDLELVPRA